VRRGRDAPSPRAVVDLLRSWARGRARRSLHWSTDSAVRRGSRERDRSPACSPLHARGDRQRPDGDVPRVRLLRHAWCFASFGGTRRDKLVGAYRACAQPACVLLTIGTAVSGSAVLGAIVTVADRICGCSSSRGDRRPRNAASAANRGAARLRPSGSLSGDDLDGPSIRASIRPCSRPKGSISKTNYNFEMADLISDWAGSWSTARCWRAISRWVKTSPSRGSPESRDHGAKDAHHGPFLSYTLRDWTPRACKIAGSAANSQVATRPAQVYATPYVHSFQPAGCDRAAASSPSMAPRGHGLSDGPEHHQ